MIAQCVIDDLIAIKSWSRQALLAQRYSIPWYSRLAIPILGTDDNTGSDVFLPSVGSVNWSFGHFSSRTPPLKRERKLANSFLTVTATLTTKWHHWQVVVCLTHWSLSSGFFTLSGLHYATCSIVMHYTEFAHVTAPLVHWFTYCLCLWWTTIDSIQTISVVLYTAPLISKALRYDPV